MPPLDAAGDGRHVNGRFGRGNGFGKGNPHARKIHALKTAMLDAVTPDDLTAIVNSLVERAKLGDVASAKIILEHCIGRPVASVKLLEGAEVPRGPWVDPESQRLFLTDPVYAAKVMELEGYENENGIAPGSAMLDRAERELRDWRRKQQAALISATDDEL